MGRANNMDNDVPIYIIEVSVYLRAEISYALSSMGMNCVVFDDVADLPERIDNPVIFFVRHETPSRTQIDAYRESRAPLSAKIEYSCDATYEKAVMAMRHGASDFVVWPSDAGTLRQAVSRARTDAQQNLAVKKMGGVAREKVSALTTRERQVLSDVINGCTTERIAAKLAISPRTVDIHRRNVLMKFNARNTAQAIVIALNSGEFQPVH